LHVTSLLLTNFRNFRHLDLRLSPHVTVVLGDNAQGKTNLLESVYLLATTKSHRASTDRELVNQSVLQDDLPFCRVCAEVERSRGMLKLDMSLVLETPALAGAPVRPEEPSRPVSVRKRLRLNGVGRRAANVVGQVNVVMFTAEDVQLVSGAPSLGRRYLDLVSCQIDPEYTRRLQRYNRVLLQRNHLLRSIQEHRARPDQLDFWDGDLAENGSYVVTKRQRLAAELSAMASGIHEELTGRAAEFQLTYETNVPLPGGFAEPEPRYHQALDQARNREIAQGMTLVGPHRDSIHFFVDGMDMARYGSRGQQQTVAVALRLAEARYMEGQVGDAPILLLDDVFAELDRVRRQHLLAAIGAYQQVLITATDLECFEPSFLDRADMLRVREGTVQPV